MQNKDADGNLIFVCDFCHQPWSDDRPMVEGHRGSIICSNCLSIAYTQVVHQKLGSPVNTEDTCLLCLEHGRDDPHWRSPMFDDAIACRRCLKQSAGVLHKDADYAWQKPRDPSED
ncbi:MAG: hypothetical protein JKY43_09395 [Phycisphaerales bacterium]|nr:hypothetical protein [Phycisphaerales bacterium]